VLNSKTKEVRKLSLMIICSVEICMAEESRIKPIKNNTQNFAKRKNNKTKWSTKKDKNLK